jgi:hypothetical protein
MVALNSDQTVKAVTEHQVETLCTKQGNLRSQLSLDFAFMEDLTDYGWTNEQGEWRQFLVQVKITD